MNNTVKGMSFVQSVFGDWLWKVTSLDDDSRIDADLQIHKGPREVDDYQLCELYDKLKENVKVFEVEYREIEGLRAHEEIVNAYYHTTLESLKEGHPIIMAGGHCTFAPGVVGALDEYYHVNKTMGIIWVDAHGDIKSKQPAITAC